MKACVTEYRISVPCTKQHGTRLPRPSPPFHLLRIAAAPRRFYSPLFSPSKVRVGASVALPPPHHTFPSNSTSNREIPPRWPLAGNTTPARPTAHHFIVDVGYSADTPRALNPYSIAHIFPSSSLCQDALACPLPSSKHTVSLFLSQENCRAL